MNLKRYLATGSRLLLGLIFTVFGLNFFLHFLPQPGAPPAAQAFAGALFASGYVFPLIKTIEVAAGVLLLTRTAVPFALVVLAPIIVNIVAFHTLLAPAGLPLALVVLATELHLAWVNRGAFAPLFARTSAAPSEHAAEIGPSHPAAA
jgi:hypothetical protein